MHRLVLALAGAVALVSAAATDAGAAPPIDIFLNDRHTGIAPTELRHARVLGALIRGTALLVPAAATFRALGASPVYDASTKTLRVTAGRTTIVLAAGRPSIEISGERRPLDAAPEVRGGLLYVPIRVVAEGLGAYVQWAPERNAVAVRTPSPAAQPSAPPTPTPAPEPAPPVATPVPPGPSPTASSEVDNHYDRYIAVDLALAPRVTNEFAANLTGRTAQAIRGGLEYHFLGRNFAEVEYRRFDYPHDANVPTIPNGTPCTAAGPAPVSGDPGCVTTIGGRGSAYVDPTRLRESQFELRTSIVGAGRAYLATSTLWHRNDYGYPKLNADIGFGAELLPRLERPASLGITYMYYPEFSGTYAAPNEPSLKLRYKVQTLSVTAQLAIPATPLFVEAGFYGDQYLNTENAPGNATHRELLLGFGLHR